MAVTATGRAVSGQQQMGVAQKKTLYRLGQSVFFLVQSCTITLNGYSALTPAGDVTVRIGILTAGGGCNVTTHVI